MGEVHACAQGGGGCLLGPLAAARLPFVPALLPSCSVSPTSPSPHRNPPGPTLPQEIEQRGVQPELYPYGSRGPVGAHYLAAKHGVRWGDLAADDE